MKRFVGYVIDKAVKALPRKKKVSPDIKSVKPTKDVKGSIKRTKSKEYTKRIDKVTKSKDKIDTGKKMMREGQKELKKMVDTKRAFKFKFGTTRQKTFPIEPGKNPKKEFKNLVEEKPTKKFKTAKQMEKEERRKRDREPFMGGGMMGRRMGYSEGKLAETPREKRLAAQYGDKKRITRGDIITIAKKKSGEEPMRDRMKQPLKRKKP